MCANLIIELDSEYLSHALDFEHFEESTGGVEEWREDDCCFQHTNLHAGMAPLGQCLLYFELFVTITMLNFIKTFEKIQFQNSVMIYNNSRNHSPAFWRNCESHDSISYANIVIFDKITFFC